MPEYNLEGVREEEKRGAKVMRVKERGTYLPDYILKRVGQKGRRGAKARKA